MSAGPVRAPESVNRARPDLNVPATMAPPPAVEPVVALAEASATLAEAPAARDMVDGPAVDGAAALPHAAVAAARTNMSPLTARFPMRLSLVITRREVREGTAPWRMKRVISFGWLHRVFPSFPSGSAEIEATIAYDQRARLTASLGVR